MPSDETDESKAYKERKLDLLERVARTVFFTTSAPMILTPRNGEVHRPNDFVAAGAHGDEETEEPVHLDLDVNGIGNFTNTAGVFNYAWGETGMSGFDDTVLTNPYHMGELTAYIPPATAGAKVINLKFTAAPEVAIPNIRVENGTAAGNRKVTVTVAADPSGGFPGTTFIRVKLEKDGLAAYDETKTPAVANWDQVFPQVLVGEYTVLVTYKDGMSKTHRTSRFKDVS